MRPKSLDELRALLTLLAERGVTEYQDGDFRLTVRAQHAAPAAGTRTSTGGAAPREERERPQLPAPYNLLPG